MTQDNHQEPASGDGGAGGALLAGGGGVAAAFASMACCTGPVALAAFGASGAAVAAAGLRPYRPLFILLAAASLWVSFRLLDRSEQRCGSEDGCSSPPARLRRTRRILWGLAGLTGVFATSPLWDGLFFGA
jgi:mercuric ion transport protein